MDPDYPREDEAQSSLCSARRRKESTEAYLIRLTLNFLNAWNEQRYGDILSADFLPASYRMQRGFGQVEPEGNPPVDLKALVQHHQKLAEDSPERRAHAVEATAIMDKHHFAGQVFVNVELTGHPPGVMYAGVIVSEWWVLLFECNMMCLSMGSMTNNSLGGGYKASGFVSGKLACEALVWQGTILANRTNDRTRSLQLSNHETVIDSKLSFRHIAELELS